MTTLLRTKLSVPPVRPLADLVPRPQLSERLQTGLNAKLSLLSAPAGFGKTTLLSSAVRSFPYPVAWLSLDEDDNDLARFLTYLAAALQAVIPEVGGSMLAAVQSMAPVIQADRVGSERWAQAIMTTLINELGAIQDDFVLVLDDYHLIDAPLVHQVLAFLLEHQPAHFHLILSGRVDPPLPLARLRARGQLVELRERDLRFSAEEATAFLNQVMNLELSAGELEALAARTEGWIAGLQLAALAMSGQQRSASAAFIRDFAGSHRFVLDYLVEEVLQRQPEWVQSFLLDTAILDRLSGSLCEAVTGRPGGQAMLEELEAANLFVLPLDTDRRWYRYHHLFADFLRARLRQVRPDPHYLSALHLRAAEWYEQHNLVEEAIDHALAAGAYGRAARLINQVARPLLMRSEMGTFLNWIEALPTEHLASEPQLCLACAWALVASGKLDRVQWCLQQAQIGDPEQQLAGEIAAVQTLRVVLQGDLRQAAAYAQQALALMSEDDPFIRGVVALNLGIVYMMDGVVEPAVQAFEEAYLMSLQAGNLLVAVLAACQLAETHLFAGHLHRALDICRQTLNVIEKDGKPLPMAGMLYALQGEVHREWNQLATAEEYVSRGIELAQHWNTLEVSTFDAWLYWSKIRQALGDPAGALEKLDRMEQVAIELEAIIFDDIMVALQRIRLCLALGDLHNAARWVDELGLFDWLGSDHVHFNGETIPMIYVLEELVVTVLVRFCLVQNDPGRALEILAPYLPQSEARGRTKAVMEMLALQALAWHAQDEPERALTTLERALRLARPEHIVRLFADEGQPMATLLQLAAGRGICLEFVGELLAILAIDQPAISVGSQIPSPAELVEPLNERELEVLQWIAAGLSNREIAERLVIAQSTVKWHINNLYRKLDVRSRTQATNRGRELGLTK